MTIWSDRASRQLAPVAIHVVDRGAYGLQELPVDRLLLRLALGLLLSGVIALPRAEQRS